MTDKLPDPSRDQWMANKVSSSVAHVDTFETHYGWMSLDYGNLCRYANAKLFLS